MFNQKKQQITDLTQQVESLTKKTTSLEQEKSALENHKNHIHKLYDETQNKVTQLNEQLTYLRTTAVPSLEQKLTAEQQKYLDVQEAHKAEVKQVLQNQDIAVVGANLSQAVDEIYKTTLQEKLAEVKERAKAYNSTDKYDYYLNWPGFLTLPELDVAILAKRLRLETKEADLADKVNYYEANFPQVIFSRAKPMTGAEFKASDAYATFVDFYKSYERPAVDVVNLPDDAVVIYFKHQTAKKSSSDCQEKPLHDLIHFDVDGEQENAYLHMLKADIPVAVTAAAIGAFENALGKQQYAMARKIADNYLTAETSSVFAPLIKDIAEKDPKAAGYFTNLKLNE